MIREETQKSGVIWRWWLLAAFVLAGGWYLLSMPWFKGREVTSIELSGVALAEITDRDMANSVFSVLRNARAASDHKCMSIGQMRLLYPNGNSEVVGLLPGHDLEFYEFRLKGKCFRMPRDIFFHELERAGVNTGEFPKRDGEETVPPSTHP